MKDTSMKSQSFLFGFVFMRTYINVGISRIYISLWWQGSSVIKEVQEWGTSVSEAETHFIGLVVFNLLAVY